MREEGGSRTQFSTPIKENIYYRDPDENQSFLGPFDEARIQWWYRQGYFHSGVQFRMGRRGGVYTLDRLRKVNGIACPFSFLINSENQSELEEISARFREDSAIASRLIMTMMEENDHMKILLQKMEKKLEETMERQKELDERLEELEGYQVDLAEKAEEWLDSLQNVEGRKEITNAMKEGDIDERIFEEIRRIENQVIYLNQERLRLNRRVGDLEATAVSMPSTRRSSKTCIESDEEREAQTRREKEGRQLMWNSCQILGHGSALLDHGSRAPEVQVKALRKALQRCDSEMREEMAAEWDRIVHFNNVKCLFCRYSLKNASDFLEHLINGPHLSILRWCNVSSDCLRFFTNKLIEADTFSDKG